MVDKLSQIENFATQDVARIESLLTVAHLPVSIPEHRQGDQKIDSGNREPCLPNAETHNGHNRQRWHHQASKGIDPVTGAHGSLQRIRRRELICALIAAGAKAGSTT